MEHDIIIYPGDYNIGTKNEIDYLYCAYPQKSILKFSTKADIKDTLRDLLKINPDDPESIKEFTAKYGLLINTSGVTNTYLGESVTPEEYARMVLISDSMNEVNMPIILFRQLVYLIQDLLLLNSALFKYKALTTTPSWELKGKNLEKERALCKKEIAQLFLNCLVKPSTIIDCEKTNMDWYVKEDTPLMNYSFNLYNFCKSNPPTSIIRGIAILASATSDCYELLYEFVDNRTIEQILGEDMDYPKLSFEYLGQTYVIPFTYIISCKTREYYDLQNVLASIFSHYIVTVKNRKIFLIEKRTDTLFDPTQLISISQTLTTDYVNAYIQNIGYKLSVTNNGKYVFNIVSESLLQGLFKEFAEITYRYRFSICKYKKCNKIVISSGKRNALCCCHTHLTNYLTQCKRDGIAP